MHRSSFDEGVANFSSYFYLIDLTQWIIDSPVSVLSDQTVIKLVSSNINCCHRFSMRILILSASVAIFKKLPFKPIPFCEKELCMYILLGYYYKNLCWF